MKNRTKTISLLMALCMMITLLPAVALAVDSYGDFTITGSDLSGVSFASGVLTISEEGTYTIKNDDPVNDTTNRIVVNAPVGTVNLVFNGINIIASGVSALTIQSPTSISMEGSSNKLAVGPWDECAAITNTFTTPVEIGGAGSMSVEGPMSGVGISGDLRLIGGSLTAFCGNSGTGIIGNVTVSGGSLTAYSSNSGNGITGNVTVSGGSLNAYSGNWALGISGTLDISGGTVEASSSGQGIGSTITISPGFNPQVRSSVNKSWGAKVNTTFTSGGTITDGYVYIGPAIYLVSFNANVDDPHEIEGRMEPQYINIGEGKTLTPNAFTRDGYTFNGWNTDPNGNGTAYADKESITPTEDITLYAQWTENNTGGGSTTPTTYTVTFDADGGYGSMATESGVSGEYTLPPNGFTAPTNKQFKCWSVEGVEKNPSDVITVSGNVTVTAVWEDKPETYYVRFMPGYQGNAGSMEEQEFTEGIPGNLNANAFTNPGYSFIGWDKVEKSGIATYTDGQEITLTKAIMGNNNTLTLYAQWKDSSMGGGNNNSGGGSTGGGNTGNIQHTTKPEENQMSGNIAMSNTEIFNNVLTDDDKIANVGIEVYLKVEDKSTVTNDEKTAIENKANGDTVAAYLDISLYKRVGNKNPVPVPNPTGKIIIKIVIPTEIFDANRTYYIIYRHNGNTKTLTGELNKQTREFTFETNEFSTYALAYKENTNPGTSSGGYSGPSIWYIGGNTFGTSTSQVPTSVEIDNVPVSFTMNGSNIVVGCVAPDADRIRVTWGSVSNSIGFTPDAAASCAQVFVPKTGDVSVMTFALMAVVAAAGAMGKK